MDEFDLLAGQVQEAMRGGTPEIHQALFEAFGISNQDRYRFVEEGLSGSAVHGQAGPSTSAIPRCVHRMWLTDPDAPSLPRDYYLARISEQVRGFPANYKHVFWHNSDISSEYISRRLPDNVEFCDISSLVSEPELSARINRAIRVNKFVLAGDMAKFLIVRECGGIYADLGVGFALSLAEIAIGKDLTLFLDQNVFFQPAFMVAPPSHHIFRLWCRILCCPEIISAICLKGQPRLTPGHEIWMHGGVGFTAILILLYDSSFGVLPVVPNRGSLHHESEGSWYRPGNRYGNVNLDDASVTHLDWERHAAYVVSSNSVASLMPPYRLANCARGEVLGRVAGFFWLDLSRPSTLI